MKKIRELLRLKYDNKMSHRQIANALAISPGTVSYYAQAAQRLGISWPIPDNLDDKTLIAQIEPLAKQLHQRKPAKIKPDFEAIHKALAQKYMTLMLLWQEYAQAYPGQHYSYTQFTRHYKKWAAKQKVSMRLEHKAGDKGFIDYAGTTIPIICRQSGKILFQAQLFVMALGLSQYTFVYASRSQSLPDWIDAHVRAFRFFGGVPNILVPDNLKSGVTDSCQFEPEANPTYADMAEHYGTAIIPARPRAPQDKSIAENAVLIASRWIIARLNRQTFYSLNALNNAIAELLPALNNKPFQKRQGSRTQQFNEQEKASLKPLPKEAYQFASFLYQTVPADYHIRVDGHYYSVPYHFVQERVLCRLTANTLEVFSDNQRIASHIRAFEKDKKTTDKAHRPKHHQDYDSWTPEVFLDWAEHIGSGVKLVAEEIISKYPHPEHSSKIHQGLKKLSQRFGKIRLNQACRRALTLHCVGYKSILSILEKGLDKTPHLQQVIPQQQPNHENIRGAAYYQQ